MNKLILCEGKIDAAFLGCYLGKKAKWQEAKKGPKNLKIEPDYDNQSANWYKKDNDYLLICAVGGKKNFGNFFKAKIEVPLLDCSFEKLAIVRDMDDEQIQDIVNDLNSGLQGASLTVQCNKWINCRYQNRYGNKKTLETLLIVTPPECPGALETLLLEAIKEDDYDYNIVVQTQNFVEQMRKEASRYITKTSLSPKVCLRVVWAIKYPDQSSTSFVEQIQKIPWKNYDAIQKCFSLLSEI